MQDQPPSIIVSITNNTRPIGDTFSIEVNNLGCSVVQWANSDPSSATYAAPEYQREEVILTIKLLACWMGMHTLCEHGES